MKYTINSNLIYIKHSMEKFELRIQNNRFDDENYEFIGYTFEYHGQYITSKGTGINYHPTFQLKQK